ncbi:hypothetical protein EIJ81_00895 (plasmid) [Aliivibrio salmonicida]|uniref:DUF7146 domain-containing protein n=1 Tax=Aliivibrio salmonicida TaxID=40269 RepID=UPI000F6EF956|nr:toprim domain-containing protein [Aliivibrio salmonicida]AZL83457.1 hypothetical protein EIJ81_00895 [Aliivibrio salmonicida]
MTFITDNVFDLVNTRIYDWFTVLDGIGLGYITDAPKKTHPCPLGGVATSGSKKPSTKFRLRADFAQSGMVHHEDLNDKRYMSLIDFICYLHGVDNVTAAKTALDICGIEYNCPEGVSGSSNFKKYEIDPQVIITRKKKQFNDGKDAIKRIAKVWEQCVVISQDGEAFDIVKSYLMTRGLPSYVMDMIPDTIRFHKDLFYSKFYRHEHEQDENTSYPAVLIKVINEKNIPTTFHRHWMNRDGSCINEPKRKMAMAAPWLMNQGSRAVYEEPLVTTIENGELHAYICLGEGWETMLAVQCATQLPIQPMINATLLQGYQPEDIEGVLRENHHLLFFGDKDKSKAGENAINNAISRLAPQGWSCHAFYPEDEIPDGKKGIDWLDVWCNSGILGFPELFQAE